MAVERVLATFEDYPDAPEFGRTSFLDTKTGIVYAPALLGGDEMNVFLCASFDGTPVVRDGDHLYVPADWLGREFPEAASACEKIIRNTIEACERDGVYP